MCHQVEPSVLPGRMGALEKTIRGYADNPADTVVKPELGTSFDSLGEAYDFYNLYSWENGFGIRYRKSRLNVTRTKCMQEIVCGCAVSCSIGVPVHSAARKKSLYVLWEGSNNLMISEFYFLFYTRCSLYVWHQAL